MAETMLLATFRPKLLATASMTSHWNENTMQIAFANTRKPEARVWDHIADKKKHKIKQKNNPQGKRK